MDPTDLLTPLTADAGTLDRALRLTHALDAWPATQRAVKLLRAHDVRTLLDTTHVEDIAQALEMSRPRVYAVAAIAREDPDTAEHAQLPAPFDALFATCTADAGTLDRALRLTELARAFPAIKHHLALLRAQDVTHLHTQGTSHVAISNALGLDPTRIPQIMEIAQGTRTQRNLSAARRPRTDPAPGRTPPGQTAKAIRAAMRTHEGPFSEADISTATGRARAAVARELRIGVKAGRITPAGMAPRGAGGRNVKIYTYNG